MKIKLLIFMMLCVNIAHSSQPEQTLTTQDFLDQFRTHFTTMERAQALFAANPTDSRFIPQASINIIKLTTILTATARLCYTESQKTELCQHAKHLQSIITEHERLIQTYQEPQSLRTAQSAIILPTQEKPLQDQQYSSFRQPPKEHKDTSYANQ